MLNIALDGPGGSGKSTVAKALAKKLNILYLDTGAMYRATALYAKRRGIEDYTEESVSAVLGEMRLEIRHENGAQKTMLCGEDVSEAIRENSVSMLASRISALRCVRLKMVEMQREIAAKYDCVLDGRDIGTFVLPNAKYKFFLTATAEVRAKRRYDELVGRGQTVDFGTVLREINERDKNDSSRDFAPLKRAEDAEIVDTSDMTANEVVDLIYGKIMAGEGRKNGD